MNILFVCSKNQWRSPTAQAIYKNYPGIKAQSAGTEASAKNQLTAGLISWANIIFVMEKKHQQKILLKFPGQSKAKKIIVLNIADEYKYMDSDLVAEIKSKVDNLLTNT